GGGIKYFRLQFIKVATQLSKCFRGHFTYVADTEGVDQTRKGYRLRTFNGIEELPNAFKLPFPVFGYLLSGLTCSPFPFFLQGFTVFGDNLLDLLFVVF